MDKPLLNIKALRIKRGLRQHELAHMIGLKQARVSEYEQGVKSPPIHRLPVIASALGVEIGDLFITDAPVESTLSPVPA